MYPTISKKKATHIRQLTLKKYRLSEGSFVLEGKKSVESLLSSDYVVKHIVATPTFLLENQNLLASIPRTTEIFQASKASLSTLGSFVHNCEVLAVACIPKEREPFLPSIGLTLALDGIQDPGNLGTMIRIADWYGINTILCSLTTVDLYNPKVLQASMGSFLKINLHYVALPSYLADVRLPILGATLDGKDVHSFVFPAGCLLVIGNESHGIDPAVAESLTETVAIPRYGQANSLNAAMATAVLCDNWQRLSIARFCKKK